MVDPLRSWSWWWWPEGPVPLERPVLFFPPAGADQTIARPLVPLAGGLRLGVLRLPGRGPRQVEPHPTDLVELATAIADSVLDLDGPPPVLVGHSFGGLLAYATACRILDRGGAVARLVAVAAASPPSWQQESVVATPDYVARRTERMLTLGGMPAHIAADPALAGRARELIAVDLGLSHDGTPLRLLDCPITVLRGRDDQMLADAALDGWSSVTSGPVDTVVVPGGHFFYRTDPQRLVGCLRMELSDLDGAYGVY